MLNGAMRFISRRALKLAGELLYVLDATNRFAVNASVSVVECL